METNKYLDFAQTILAIVDGHNSVSGSYNAILQVAQMLEEKVITPAQAMEQIKANSDDINLVLAALRDSNFTYNEQVLKVLDLQA